MLCARWKAKLMVGGLLWLEMLLPIPLSAAQAQATEPLPDSFEVASIKRSTANEMSSFNFLPSGRFSVTQFPLKFLLEQAYHVQDRQLSGVPDWFENEHYDINAATGEAGAAAMAKLSADDRYQQLTRMLQTLFVVRFQLASHRESKELPIYVLLVAKSGLKMKETVYGADGKPRVPPQDEATKGQPPGGIQMATVGGTVQLLADAVSRFTGRPVVDETGLKGKYNVALRWNPRIGRNQMMDGADGNAAPPADAGPDIFTALQEQLGLKLESRKLPIDVLVIDRLERPSEN